MMRRAHRGIDTAIFMQNHMDTHQLHYICYIDEKQHHFILCETSLYVYIQ